MSDHVEVPTRMLVHALVGEDGTVDAGELYDVAGVLGMSDQQVRLCVKRLVAEGRFAQEGRGRKAVLRATAETMRDLVPDADFLDYAFQQDAGLAPWDGVWHLAAFAVPEAARGARDALREKLLYLGGSLVQGGLYVSANAWEPYVEDEARRLGVHDALTLMTSTDLRRGETSDPVELARGLWPVQEIAARYERLGAVARPRWERLAGPGEIGSAELLTMAVELAAELTRAMEPDPLLPPELLPQPWPGTEARGLVARCWTVLHERDRGTMPSLFRLHDEIARRAGTSAASSGPKKENAAP
ncbi:PaaX family transcriptional regulator C-terminal domain-containing protein [Actinomadura hibisca]|uniref:PaaX family transcriptional regulator C-terminal domain-containing protein n=1 Tax=Actinomadura hibisca TaxID=68565 RepID=UPI001FE09884|nr:PaaX family transcriptional regulator C-terminal domain-containing protein [Actinomadura hibisca]